MIYEKIHYQHEPDLCDPYVGLYLNQVDNSKRYDEYLDTRARHLDSLSRSLRGVVLIIGAKATRSKSHSILGERLYQTRLPSLSLGQYD